MLHCFNKYMFCDTLSITSAFKIKLVIYPTFLTVSSFSLQGKLLETLDFISMQIFKIISGVQRKDKEHRVGKGNLLKLKVKLALSFQSKPKNIWKT